MISAQKTLQSYSFGFHNNPEKENGSDNVQFIDGKTGLKEGNLYGIPQLASGGIGN